MNPNQQQQTISHLETSITELTNEFLANPGVFLTEEDLRTHLVAKLLRNELLSTPQRTQREDVLSIPVHSEVRWYGTLPQQERFLSDIVILDPRGLETVDPIRTKGYAFENFYAVIELKLRRLGDRADAAYIQLIRDDYSRLVNMIDNRENRVPRYYHLCFDKKVTIEEKLAEFTQNPRIDFRYHSSFLSPEERQ